MRVVPVFRCAAYGLQWFTDTNDNQRWSCIAAIASRAAPTFFTVTLRDRSSALLVEHIGLLRAAFRAVRAEHPFRVDAIVVLPDHLHAIWTLPVDDADYPGRWRSIKSRFTRSLQQRGVPLHRDGRGEYRLWQRRYWEHTIRDDRDRERHVDYLHFNPVKHGLVGYVADWPYSSFHRFVRLGLLPRDWAGVSVAEAEGGFGEPAEPFADSILKRA